MMIMIWADLHCHTTCSDGSTSPEELIRLAKQKGLKGLSITDHDTIEAYSKAIPIAKEEGIQLGTGVEFSCQFKGFNLHLLGYDFDLSSKEIIQASIERKKNREIRNKQMLEQLKAYHCFIDYEELVDQAKGSIIGRPHIAMAMLKKGYIKHFSEAFQSYIGEDQKCYVSGFTFSVEEILTIIHQGQGKAFIAHPHLLPLKFPIHDLLQLDFKGLEAFYCKLPEKKWVKIAQRKNWLLSGGSDYHGSFKPHIEIGCNGVSQEVFNTIFSKPVT